MWFKDISTWSQNKLKYTWLAYAILYLVFSLIIPIICVATKYNLIKESSTKLTGVGLILILCIAVFLIKGCNRLIAKLPQENKKEQCFKFMIQMVYALLFPVCGLIIVSLIKQNVTLACDTISYCLYSLICAIVLDHLTLKFLECEWDLRQEAKHQIEVNKRVSTLSN